MVRALYLAQNEATVTVCRFFIAKRANGNGGLKSLVKLSLRKLADFQGSALSRFPQKAKFCCVRKKQDGSINSPVDC